jgi:GNAT superfamily N-acetyltransferase
MGDNENIDPPAPEDPLAGVPELKTYMARDQEDKVAALKLVADSIAQMRQTANNYMISHPLNLAIAIAIVAVVVRYMLDTKGDTMLAATTGSGIIFALLAALRYLTKDYIFAAEEINWEWLGDADIIVTKFGEEVIGTAIIDWVSGESRQKRKKAWRGEIKAWTVRLKYRRKGVGAALLEEAVKEAKKKGAETIEFADVHASEWCRSIQSSNTLLTFLTRFEESPPRLLQQAVREARAESTGCAAGVVGVQPCAREEEVEASPILRKII